MAKAKYTKGKDGYFKTRVWDGTYDDVGRKRYVTIRSKKSSKDLENKVNEHKKKIKNREYVTTNDIMFCDYAKRWESVYKASRAGNTRAIYQHVINKYFACLEGVKLADISRIHYQTVLNDAIGHPPTQQKIKLTFKQVIKSAIAEQALSPNIADIIFSDDENIKYKPKERRVLTDKEKYAVFSADLLESDRVFLFIIYGCGLRRGEALALTKDCINLENHTLTVNQSLAFEKETPYIKEPKSHNGYRTVPIPDIIFPTVEKYAQTLSQDKLFHMKDGRWITKSSYRKMWDRIIRKMQSETKEPIIGLTAHVFRHNYCTNLCYQIPAISIKHIATLLGDTEKMVMGVYNHMILEKENVEEALNNALNF